MARHDIQPECSVRKARFSNDLKSHTYKQNIQQIIIST